MYCGKCGAKVNDYGRYCGKCGAHIATPPKGIVYEEEKPMTPILEDRSVVALTFCILLLSILTIIVTSVITRDVPTTNQLDRGEIVFQKI